MSKYEKYIGQLFDDIYRIDKIIGIGGTAVVFEAYDTQNDRKVAIKMLREEMNEKKDAVLGFVNESKTVSVLEHDNIVKVYRVNTKGAVKYMVMERIEGVTLKKYMDKKGALNFALTLSVAKQVLDALDHAHNNDVIHRDIKPQNIMLKKNGTIVVTDFGIAAGSREFSGDKNGNAVGTVSYISPEQAEGKAVDKRNDIYSLGVMMYEMITGVLPFTGDTPENVAFQHVHNTPTPPHQYVPTIPSGLEQIILHAMEKEADKRFASASEMKRYIEQLEEDPFAVFDFTSKPTVTVDKAVLRKKRKEQIKFLKKNAPKAKEDSFSITPSILGVFCAFMCVAIVSAIYILINIFPTSILNIFDNTKSEDVVIQNYMYTVYNDQLYYELIEDGYKVEVEYELNNSYPENTVIGQSPSAGRVMKETALEIKFTVSIATKKMKLENYTMTDYRVSQKALEELGYRVVVNMVSNQAIDNGMVISMLPSAGTTVEYGSTVELYVSEGASLEMLTAPNLVMKSEGDVAAILAAQGYRLGSVIREFSSTVEKGCIISQSIAPGSNVAKGTVISLVISLGPDPDAVQPTPEPSLTPEPSVTPMPTVTPSVTATPDANVTATPDDPITPDDNLIPAQNNG